MEYIELLNGNISVDIKTSDYTKYNDYYLYTEYKDKNIIPYITFHTNAERKKYENVATENKLYTKRIVLESIKGQGLYFYYISLIVYLSDYINIAKTLLGNINKQKDDTIKTKLTESFYDILESVLKTSLYGVIDTTKINLRKSYIEDLDEKLLTYLNEVLIEFMKLVKHCKEKMKEIQETMKDTDEKITMKINVNLVKSLWNSLIKKSNTKILDKDVHISLLGYLLHKMGLIHLVHCNESLNKTSSVFILKLAQSYFGSWKNLFTHTFIKDIQSTIEILQEYNAKKRITGDFKIENCEGDTNKKNGGNTKKYTKHLKHNRNNKNITKKLR